jgi:hypothetical protein
MHVLSFPIDVKLLQIGSTVYQASSTKEYSAAGYSCDCRSCWLALLLVLGWLL